MPLGGPRIGRPGLIGTAARTAVIAGTAQAVSGRVARRQQEKAYEQAVEQGAVPAATPAPQTPPAAPQASPEAAAPVDPAVAQLQQLAALKDQGILTEEEFAAKKAQILGI